MITMIIPRDLSFSVLYESLKANTVLILDGVDTMMDDVDHSIIQPLQSSPSTTKIITSQ